MRILRSLVPLIGGLALLSGNCFSQAVSFTRIVASDTLAPDEVGAPTTDKFAFFSDVTINESGYVAVRGGLKWDLDTGVDNDSGLWTNCDGGTLKLLALEGDTAPGTAAFFKEVNGSGYHPVLTNSGHVMFRCRLFVGNGSQATSYTNQGIWKGNPTSGLSLVARKQDADIDPGTNTASGATIDLTNRLPVMGDTGNYTAFFSSLYVARADSNATTADRNGIWASSPPAALVEIARSAAYDDPDIQDAPDTGGKHFATLSAPVVSPDDTMAFMGNLRTEPSTILVERVTSANCSGIWMAQGWPANPFEAVLRANDTLCSEGLYNKFFAPSINSNNDLAFRASLMRNGPIDLTNDTGIWLLPSGGSPALIAREGFPAYKPTPAVPGSRTQVGAFAGFTSRDPLVGRNSVGTAKVAFVGFLQRINGINFDSDTGIWAGTTGADLVAIALENGMAYEEDTNNPGVDVPITAPPGSVIRFQSFDNPSVNDNGQIAFIAQLKSSPTGLTSSNKTAIFAQTTTGTLVKVIRTSDTLMGKTVKSLSFVSGSGGSDGRPRGWVYNAGTGTGQLAFVAGFTDSSWGVFVASVN